MSFHKQLNIHKLREWVSFTVTIIKQNLKNGQGFEPVNIGIPVCFCNFWGSCPSIIFTLRMRQIT